MTDLTKIKAQMLELDPTARAALVDFLLESLDVSEPGSATQAWFDEVMRRRQEVASGAVSLLPGDDLLDGLES